MTRTEHENHVDLSLRWHGPLDSGAEVHEAERIRQLGVLDSTKPIVVHTPQNRLLITLACYTAQLGRLDESKEWFKTALALDTETVRAAGSDDPDLKPLWSSMSGTMWKRE